MSAKVRLHADRNGMAPPASGGTYTTSLKSLAGIGGIGESRFLQTTNRGLLQCTRHRRFSGPWMAAFGRRAATESAPRPPWRGHNALIGMNLTLRARHVRKPRAANRPARVIRARVGAVCKPVRGGVCGWSEEHDHGQFRWRMADAAE